MANANNTTKRHRRKREKLKGQCRLWLRMRDNQHDNAAQFWADHRPDMDVNREVAQLQALKGRMDNNPKYPGPVGMAIIYFHADPDKPGTEICRFDIEQGNGWARKG